MRITMPVNSIGVFKNNSNPITELIAKAMKQRTVTIFRTIMCLTEVSACTRQHNAANNRNNTDKKRYNCAYDI
jgi:hypothetical protein